MFSLRKIASTFCLTSLLTASAFAGGQMQDYSIEFSIPNAPAEIFEGKLLIQGSYVTKDATGSVIDPGYFMAVVKHESPYEDLTNANMWKNKIMFFFYGENGIAQAKFEGKTLVGKSNEIEFKKGSGIYENWKSSKTIAVTNDLENPTIQSIFNLTMKVSK